MDGQCSASNPGAAFNRSLETSSTYSFFCTLYTNALNGIANSFSPMPRKPPNDTTAYATLPVRGSMTTSLMSPRLSPSGLTTSVPMMLDAFTGGCENTRGWLIVVLLLLDGWKVEFSGACIRAWNNGSDKHTR